MLKMFSFYAFLSQIHIFASLNQTNSGFGIQSESKTKNAENEAKLRSFQQFCFLIFTACRSLDKSRLLASKINNDEVSQQKDSIELQW